MKITDETVQTIETAEKTEAFVSDSEPVRRRLFYIESGKRSAVAKVLIGGILTLALFSMVINSYVQLNEVYSQISTEESLLKDLQSENVRMQTKLEGQASIRNIKEYAENRLKLQKLNHSQIQYIQIQTEDEIIVEEPEQNIFVQIKQKFNDLIAYLRG